MDTAEVADTSISSTANADTATTGPGNTDTQTQAAPVADGTTTQAGQVDETSNPVDDGSSPTTLNTTPQNTQKPAAPPAAAQPDTDWKNRYGELRSYQTKQAEELKRLKEQYKQFDGVDPQVVQSFRQQQEQAKQQQLPVWNPKHPQKPHWDRTWTKYQTFQQQLANAPDHATKELIAKNWQGQFQPFETDLIRAKEQEDAAFNERFHADPKASIMEMIGDEVEKRVQDTLQRRQLETQADQDVGSWFNDPKNAAIVQTQGSDMYARLQKGQDWETVREMAQMRAQLSALQGRVGEAETAKTTADERDRLVKSRASVNRDPGGSKQVDPMLVAKERGVKPGTPAYLDILLQLKSEGSIS